MVGNFNVSRGSRRDGGPARREKVSVAVVHCPDDTRAPATGPTPCALRQLALVNVAGSLAGGDSCGARGQGKECPAQSKRVEDLSPCDF